MTDCLTAEDRRNREQTREIRARRERDKITKESHVLRGVLDLLAAHNVIHYRLNSGEGFVDTGEYDMASHPLQRRIRLCPPGTPDVLAFLPWGLHRPLFIETKRPSEKKLRATQEAEHERLREAGLWVITITDVDELKPWLRPPVPE